MASCRCLLAVVVLLVSCFSASMELNFENVPPMEPDKFVTNPEYQKDSYEVLRDMTEGFVGVVQPKTLNYDAIQNLIKQIQNEKDISINDEILEMMEYNVGIIICFAIGVVFVLAMPLVGLIFCCCRCCGKCGGKLEQKETKMKKCKRIYFSIALLIIAAVMGAGMAYSNFVNERITEGIGQIEDSYNNILSDTSSYMEFFSDQVDHVLKVELDKLQDSVVDNVAIIDDKVLQPVVETVIDPVLNPLLNSTDKLISEINQTSVLLSDLDENLSELLDLADQLAANLSSSQTDLNTLIISCGTICIGIDTTTLQVGIDVDSIPSVGDDLEELNNITKNDLERYKKEIQEGYDTIEETINNATAEAVNQTEEYFEEIDESITDILSEFDSLITNVEKFIDDAQNDNDDLWNLIYTIDDYRTYSCYGITAAILLLILFIIGGLALGTCGTKSKVKPTERGQLSNAGGNFLMVGVFFTFLFSFIIMIAVMSTFLIFASLDQLCEPLESLELFEQTIDKEGLFVDDGYYLGDVLLQNASVPLKLSEVLNECKLNATLYGALKLEYSYPLDEIEKYTSSEELDKITQDLIDEVDFSWEVELITPEIEEELRNLTDVITGLELDNITSSLNSSIVQTDLTTFADDLDILANNSSLNESTRNGLSEQADILRSIEIDLVKKMENLVVVIESEVDQLETLSDSVTTLTELFISDAKKVEEVINSNSTKESFEDSTIKFVSENLDDVSKYGIYLIDQIYHDVGVCKPISNMYDAAVVSLCNYGIQTINLLWFTYGWCLFFFIPSIIYSVKLAKYYRTMRRLASLQSSKQKRKNITPEDEEDYEETIGMDAINSQLILDQRGGGSLPYAGSPPYGGGGHANPQYVHEMESMPQQNVMYNSMSDPPPYSNNGIQQLDHLLYNNAPKNNSNWQFGSGNNQNY